MRTILSVGGSIVAPKGGFDIDFLKRFKQFIAKEARAGRRFVIIVGGGATCRSYQEALRRTAAAKAQELDWMGIYATVLNAQFMRMVLGKLAYREVVMDPRRRMKSAAPVIVGSGWRPGASSDYDAVLAAKTYGAQVVHNLSNVSFVFDRDPLRFPNSKPLQRLGWSEYRRLCGSRWRPGGNLPFDPVAARTAERLGLTVHIMDGRRLSRVSRSLAGKPFVGTVLA